MNLIDARIVLTGAAGGIGSATAARLAQAGAKLVLTDLEQEPLDRLAAQLGPANVLAAVAADVASDAGRAAVVSAARQYEANVLINLAGINPFGLFEEQTAREIARTISINAVAPLLLCHALLPILLERPGAHIVNVGSTFGSIGFPGFAAYSASKFAVRGFSEALRRELADTDVRVHYVAPRATRTALATDRVRALNAELGVGMDTPQTVAAAIVRALRDERREVLLGVPERLFAKLNALMPAVVDRSLRRQLAVVRRYASPAAPRAAASLSPTHR
ncbi:MAG TPA: SDR family oxidoreductase [Gammaproteobacteria bacterium]|nr:SDR family oxidoreductase [Gammaproteobacteria bacterium]